jgi:hypothetical protein
MLAPRNGLAHAEPVKKTAATPRSQAPVPSRDYVLTEIGEIIARLSALEDHERDEVLRGAYRAAMERLSALAYRLKVKPETHVIGLPTKQTAPPPAPEPPQRTLPLGRCGDREGAQAEAALSSCGAGSASWRLTTGKLE